MEARAFPGAAPRAPLRAVPMRPLRAADQGPFDWLLPFIPPFLRVNRSTREQIWTAIAEATSPEAIKLTAERVTLTVRMYGKAITKWAVIAVVWTASLFWVHANVHELATTYVILSAFVGLCIHVLSGETTTAVDIDGEKLSAYSVFNKGARRMMGSLSAEQFENEIRHRGPGHVDDDGAPIRALRADASSDDDEDDDPDLIEALRQSLEEKKREERRQRRTQRRR